MIPVKFSSGVNAHYFDDSYEYIKEAQKFRSWNEWGGSTDGYTFGSAVKMVQMGRPPQISKTFELRDKILGAVRTSPVDTLQYDVAGSVVDVGRYLAGDPECMGDWADSPAKTAKHLHLAVSWGVNGCDTEAYALRGAAYMALIDALEASRQYRLHLYAVAYATEFSGGWGTIIRLKHGDQPYDPSMLAAYLTEVAVFRLLDSAYVNHQVKNHRYWGHIRECSAPNIPAEVCGDDPVLNLTNYQPPHNAEHAKQWVIDQLAEQNINITSYSVL